MKHSRKKRTPTLDLDQLKETGSQIRSEGEMGKLKAYFSLLEEMKIERSLNTPFISMEALARITTAYSDGYSEDEVAKAYPDAWGAKTISVPAPLLKALQGAWDAYRSADGSVSLGESLGVEGKGQGKSKMKRKLEQRIKENGVANQAEVNYLASGNSDESESYTLEEAINSVASSDNPTFETFRKYHTKHAKNIRKALKNMGIIKGE